MAPSPRRRAHDNGRELHALAALLLWMGGFEVAPLAHVLVHEHVGPHAHDRDGIVLAERDGGQPERGHCHGGHCHSHDTAPDREHEPAAGERVDVDLSHGAHSLAHRDLAADSPPPAVAAVEGPLWAANPDEPELYDLTSQRGPLVARARGPPSVRIGI